MTSPRTLSKMRTKSLRGFSGLDLRNIDEVSDPTTFREAVNIDLTTGGGFQARTQLRLYTMVDALSVGLYIAADQMRVAYPLRSGTAAPKPPFNIAYDFISVPGEDPANPPLRVTAAAAWHNEPYLTIERNGTVPPTTNTATHEVHHIPATQSALISDVTYVSPNRVLLATPLPANVVPGATFWFQSFYLTVPTGSYLIATINNPARTDVTLTGTAFTTLPAITSALVFQAGSTLLSLPFVPGPALIIFGNRLWVGDRETNNPWRSSIGEPTNWDSTPPNDSGFLPASTHTDGNMLLQGFGIFKDMLALFYERVIQLWDVTSNGGDPDYMRLMDSIGGAGTKYPKSVANMMGDLVYFSQGGFRAISAVVMTGQTKEGDIGAKIQPMTQLLGTDLASLPVSLWSPSRSQYLCAIGTQMFVFTNSPLSQTQGWTTYTIPFEVEAMVEFQGKVYLRRKNTGEIWVFDPVTTDEPGFAWSARIPFFDFETEHYIKHFKLLEVHQTGECDVAWLVDPNDPLDALDHITINGSTSGAGKFPLNFLCEVLSHRFSGALPCRVDEILVRFDMGNIV